MAGHLCFPVFSCFWENFFEVTLMSRSSFPFVISNKHATSSLQTQNQMSRGHKSGQQQNPRME
jgi:hypothetical protein